MTRAADINEENDRKARAKAEPGLVQRLRRLSGSLRIADHPDNRLILHPPPANYYAAMVAEAADRLAADNARAMTPDELDMLDDLLDLLDIEWGHLGQPQGGSHRPVLRAFVARAAGSTDSSTP